MKIGSGVVDAIDAWSPASDQEAFHVWAELCAPGSGHIDPERLALADPVVDKARLASAFRRLVERHDILRTRYRLTARGIERRVGSSSETARLQESASVLTEDEWPVFDLVDGPLAACRIAPDATGLKETAYLHVHHAVADDAARTILAAELKALYEGSAADAPAPPQYSDFTRWQAKMLRLHGAEHASHWERVLSDPPLGFPMASLFPPEPATWSAVRLAVPPEVDEAMRAAARRARTTPFAAYFAAFCSFASARTGCDDMVVGSAVDARPLVAAANGAGCYATPVLLRWRSQSSDTFDACITRARRVLLDAITHLHCGHQEAFGVLGAAAAELGVVPQIPLSFHGMPAEARSAGHDGPADLAPADPVISDGSSRSVLLGERAYLGVWVELGRHSGAVIDARGHASKEALRSLVSAYCRFASRALDGGSRSLDSIADSTPTRPPTAGPVKGRTLTPDVVEAAMSTHPAVATAGAAVVVGPTAPRVRLAVSVSAKPGLHLDLSDLDRHFRDEAPCLPRTLMIAAPAGLEAGALRAEAHAAALRQADRLPGVLAPDADALGHGALASLASACFGRAVTLEEPLLPASGWRSDRVARFFGAAKSAGWTVTPRHMGLGDSLQALLARAEALQSEEERSTA